MTALLNHHVAESGADSGAEVGSIAGLPPNLLTRERIAQLTRHVCVGPNPKTETVLAPFTLKPMAEIPVSDEAAVDTAFAIARQAQQQWQHTTMAHRSRILLRFHDLVLARKEEGLDIVQVETGKSRMHAVEELLDCAITARYYARTSKKALKNKRHAGVFPVISSVFEVHHPKGVIGIISPWNYPLNLSITDAMPALMAGNGVVLKASLQTTLTALWAVDLMYEAGIPEGLLQVVAGQGSSVGPLVIERGDYIMFTGSTSLGRDVAARCGERLVGCSMELGGKNAMIVCDDANISKGAEIAERACFANSGQLCISMERIYVHNSVRDEFTAAFVARTKKLKQQAKVGWGYDVGSLISEKQLSTVVSHVDDAVSKGATVLAGGMARPDIGPLFYEPTILTDVDASMTVFAHETFGPVVSIYGFDTEDEAIALANDTVYGLNASVITRDETRGQEIAVRLHAGTVNVNEAYATTFAATGAPMGGFGESGIGRRHGREGLLKYTEPQTVGTQRIMGWGAPPFVDAKIYSEALIALVKGLKWMGKK
ncbi:MAG: succinic semialdehyde dehydrogenase [Actinomycetes bacterium]